MTIIQPTEATKVKKGQGSHQISHDLMDWRRKYCFTPSWNKPFHHWKDIFRTEHMLCITHCISIPVINLTTNRCVRMLGKLENCRLLQVALFQGTINKNLASLTMEMQASDNPLLQIKQNDPTLFCTAYKKNRFYIFARRPPADTKGWVCWAFRYRSIVVTVESGVPSDFYKRIDFIASNQDFSNIIVASPILRSTAKYSIKCHHRYRRRRLVCCWVGL